MLRCIVLPDSNHVTCKNKIQTFQISKYIVFKNKWWSNLHLIKYAFNKISYKDKRQMFFLHYIYADIYTEISKQQLGRKYKALQGIVIKHFVFLCLSPLQKAMENTLENAFSSVLEGHNFKFFSPLSTHHGVTLGVIKYNIFNSMQQYPTVCPKNPWIQYCNHTCSWHDKLVVL